MKLEHLVSIVLVAVTLLVVVAFLIAIIVELRRTYMRLITILGAVGETIEKTDGLDNLVGGIANDLAAGQSALAAAVDRLEQRLGGGATTNGAPDGGSVSVSQPPPDTRGDVFSNY
jgi:hypothetical protein